MHEPNEEIASKLQHCSSYRKTGDVMLIDMSGGMRLQAYLLAQEAAEQLPGWSGDLPDQVGMSLEAKQSRGGKKARQRQRKQVAAG